LSGGEDDSDSEGEGDSDSDSEDEGDIESESEDYSDIEGEGEGEDEVEAKTRKSEFKMLFMIVITDRLSISFEVLLIIFYYKYL
jgi:hypothetical protein